MILFSVWYLLAPVKDIDRVNCWITLSMFQ